MNLDKPYFDQLLESMVKGTKERCHRQTRIKNPDPNNGSPVKKMEHGLQRHGDNNPMKTGRGALSVKRQARKNQQHPEKFAEAIAYVDNHQTLTVEESIKSLDSAGDLGSLRHLLRSLMESDYSHKQWARAMVEHLDGKIDLVLHRLTQATGLYFMSDGVENTSMFEIKTPTGLTIGEVEIVMYPDGPAVGVTSDLDDIIYNQLSSLLK